MPPKKDKQQPAASLTFNPGSVGYSLGMLANLAKFKVSYFIDEGIADPVLKDGENETRGFIEIANKIKELSETEKDFFQKLLPSGYLKPSVEQVEQLIGEQSDLPADPKIETLLILGSPAVVDAEDLSSYPKLKALSDHYATNGLIKASKGQVGVAFKKYEQQQASNGPTLKDAKMGEVVTRFPPEPSGYLHIGHSKAAILNSYFAKKYQGKLHFRLDDTNPAKENPDFVQNIQKDLKTLGVEYQSMSYTSDHFELIQNYCEKMIKQGLAYCDQTVQEVMKAQRMNGEVSSFRDTPVEWNLRLWSEMLSGTEEGLKTCVRAKEETCMQNPNKCMRDFVIYRCSKAEHHRTGTKYKAYPTYDFACPIVDSVEGITHALRTTEFLDRNEQYQWLCQKLQIRCPIIQDFSRLRMQYSLMSKRHLAWFVEQGKVSGWMDPRFPTVQGMNRRGLRIDALRDFIIDQGASRRVNYQEWSKLWAINKGYLEPSAFRFHNILGDGVEITLKGVKEADVEVPLHPKNNKLGTKKIHVTNKILISESDIQDIKATKAEKVTLMNLGNFKIISENEWELMEGDNNFSGTLKLTWLPSGFSNLSVSLRYFSQLCTKPMLGPDDDFKNYVNEQSMREFNGFVQDNFLDYVKEHDTVQLERVGFFYIDKVNDAGVTPRIIMHFVPDGSKKRIRIGNQEFDDE